ncbi:CidA/LrgA family protein [Fictibacillus fluitans]|uniref:CidA/LrgA family protein n=1 Tax=Fictibacillus fluitans TaxID=3058422 RepID=A0ABT8HZD1_9BACL|nr:CidA/LrgA family protein [Fictibacillus sp. NE201]MDN4526137.1 CidA/LrgA family protein [Fictibacillus sp. NE201]
MLRIIGQFMIVLTALAAGNILSSIFHLPLPGSMLGMFLLLLGLLAGMVKLSWVEGAADSNLRHMTLLFIPPVVGLFLNWGAVHIQLWKVLLVLSLSSLCILLGTGYSVELYEKRKRRRNE